MSISAREQAAFSDKSALLVGLGGLGCPAALALVRAGIGRLLLCDDDVVQESNLHRQILYRDADIGLDKLDCAQAALERQCTKTTHVELVRSRFLPRNARSLARSVNVVIEGADNFATKFLTADACALERRPVVHGAGVRWHGTAWAVAAEGRPCYRCLFEDVPATDDAPNCAEAGVMGPVVGVVGALMADLALRVLSADPQVFGALFSYDGKLDRLRSVTVAARPGCPLCGQNRTICDIDEARYAAPSCAA
jgi:molybdopterin/thiamine biosynthesis adenylyltransferase